MFIVYDKDIYSYSVIIQYLCSFCQQLAFKSNLQQIKNSTYAASDIIMASQY